MTVVPNICTRHVQRLYNGCTRDVQGTNMLATPEQPRSNAGAARSRPGAGPDPSRHAVRLRLCSARQHELYRQGSKSTRHAPASRTWPPRPLDGRTPLAVVKPSRRRSTVESRATRPGVPRLGPRPTTPAAVSERQFPWRPRWRMSIALTGMRRKWRRCYARRPRLRPSARPGARAYYAPCAGWPVTT